MRYSAFISYNHADRPWAAWLHRELERYRLPDALLGRESPLGNLERRLPPVFQDREELAASSNLASSVREALEQAHSLIVICSTNAAQSHWVNEEVREFVRLGRRERIQCLIVPEAGDPDAPPHPSAAIFPPALLELGEEPLAADARKSGDGKRAAFLKLLAGVIGVRYDELRQREHARRQKRLMIFAAAASLGFLLMSGLAAFAFVSPAEAVRERDLARQKTITAQRTTDFVKGLFQVSDPSEAKGRSISALEVLDRGAREIQGQLDNEPDVKAELISTLSEVYMGLGSFRRADQLIRGSLGLKVARDETRARQLGVLAASQGLQADYEGAVATFTHALQFVKKPEQLQDLSLYSRLLVGKAEALAGLERYSEAMPLIKAALAWDRQHEGDQSEKVARDYEVAGLTTQYAGDLEATRANYEKALAVRLRVNGRLHPRVAEDYNNLGTAAYLLRDSPAAEKYWRQALAVDERILGPAHPDIGVILNNLARVLVEQRKFEQAIPLLNRSANIYLAQQSDTHDDLAFVFSNLALAQEGSGRVSEAAESFARALRAAQVHNNRLVAPIMVDLADLQCRRGEHAEALGQLARAVPIMKAQYPNDAWRSAWVENTRGACLLRQGDVTSAKPLIRASSAIILERWPAQTLYGSKTEQRTRALVAAERR
jgi:tetratricopeptide (TPR) repeat protein